MPVALSADGNRVAGCPSRGTVAVWDVATGKRIGSVGAVGVARLALSRDGTLLVTFPSNGPARLWDVQTGKERTGFKGNATAGLFAPDVKTLLLGDDRRVRIWDVTTGKEMRRLDGEARLLALSRDGRTLAPRGRKAIRLWDPTTGELKRSLAVSDELLHLPQPEDLALSADGRTAALAGNGHLFAWDCATGRELLRRIDRINIDRINWSWYTSVALSPDGGTLFWGLMHVPVIHRWDLQAGRALFACPAHENYVQGLAFAPDGSALASGGTDRTIHLWRRDPAAGWKGAKVLPTDGTMLMFLAGRVAWSPDGKWLAMALSGDEVCLRDAKTGKVERTFTGAKGCFGIAFSPDGQRLAVGDGYFGKSSHPQGRVLVWEVATGRLLHTLSGHQTVVRSVAFSPDGKRLATGSDDVRVWELSRGRQVRRFPVSNFVDALVFTADGRSLIAGGDQARVWDVDSGVELRCLGSEHGWVTGVALSPDGRLLATTGNDGLVRLWDFHTGEPRAELAGHAGRPHVVAFSPDGKTLASGGIDTTVLLWDVPAALGGERARTPAALAQSDLERLWDELGKADAPTGQRAIWALVDSPALAVPFLRDKLGKPGRGVDTDRIVRLVADLDADDFATRQRASAGLDKLGQAAVPALRAALRRKPSLDAVRRIERLLQAHDRRTILLPAGDALRSMRAVQTLEWIGTPAARKALQMLADGPPAPLSEDAHKALARLDRRTGGR